MTNEKHSGAAPAPLSCLGCHTNAVVAASAGGPGEAAAAAAAMIVAAAVAAGVATCHPDTVIAASGHVHLRCLCW